MRIKTRYIFILHRPGPGVLHITCTSIRLIEGYIRIRYYYTRDSINKYYYNIIYIYIYIHVYIDTHTRITMYINTSDTRLHDLHSSYRLALYATSE